MQSQREPLNLKQAIETINQIFDGLTDVLIRGERIGIREFGVFFVRNYKSYTGRNLKTGMNIDVKPKRMAIFKMGKEL